MRKKNKKWSYELLHKTALQYETRSEFQKGSWSAYVASHRRGILDDVCSHMNEVYTSWTEETLHEEALKYNTRSEFANGSKSAYDTCLRRGILDDVCSHMEPHLTYWDKEMLQEEALKYETRYEFQKGSVSAYEASRSRGILNDICQHMQEPEHYSKPHCVYLIEIFTEDDELYYYVGQTHRLKKRLIEHFKYSQDSPVIDFLNKNDIKYKKHYIVKDQLTFEESLELERETIKDLKDRGIKLLNKDLYIYNTVMN